MKILIANIISLCYIFKAAIFRIKANILMQRKRVDRFVVQSSQAFPEDRGGSVASSLLPGVSISRVSARRKISPVLLGHSNSRQQPFGRKPSCKGQRPYNRNHLRPFKQTHPVEIRKVLNDGKAGLDGLADTLLAGQPKTNPYQIDERVRRWYI
jgi:hypothetical protein